LISKQGAEVQPSSKKILRQIAARYNTGSSWHSSNNDPWRIYMGVLEVRLAGLEIEIVWSDRIAFLRRK